MKNLIAPGVSGPRNPGPWNSLRPAALVFGLLTASCLNHATAADLKVGDKAPAFELVGSDGKTYRLEDFSGEQAVVVAWFPKAFTGG